MTKGKVSIVMPFYKSEDYVERMIKAIQGQTYEDWELLAISNGPDQQKQNEIVANIANRDHRIRLISVEQGGVSNARNIGIESAIGDWIIFVDADDFIDSNHIQNFMDVVDESSELVVMGYTMEKAGSKITQKVQNLDSSVEGLNSLIQKYLSYYESLYYAPWNKLFSKKILIGNNLRFDKELSYTEDGVFCLQTLNVVKRLQLVDSTTYHYIINSPSASFKYHACMERVFDLIGAIKRDLYQRIGMPQDFVQYFTMEKEFIDVYFLMANQYRPGAEKVSQRKKIDNIKRWTRKQEFIDARKWYMSKPRGIAHKLFNLILSFRSPYVIHCLLWLQYKAIAMIHNHIQ